MLTNLPQAFASFTDVNATHKNATAIEYLQQNNILEGYSDGTFRPETAINRVEFLKVVLEGSNVTMDKTQFIQFKDINNNAWYISYLKKAYFEGWINGYPDNTFKPDQTINKVEALKIIGKVQGWDLSTVQNINYFSDTQANAWYTPYVRYAKEHGLLEETGTLLSPDKLMTRANVSEIIYRSFSGITPKQVSIVTDPILPEIVTDSIPTTPPQANEFLSFTPYQEKTYPTNYYQNITLTNPLPNTFYQNEVYIIEGTVSSNTYDSASALLENDNETMQDTFTSKAKNNVIKIPIYFKTSGNFYIGLIPGSSGTTKLAPISVLPELPTSTNTDTSNTASYIIEHANDSTFFNISSPSNSLKKITISQDSKSVTYISRQNITQIPIQYKDFRNFQEGVASYKIDTAKIETQAPLKIISEYNEGQTKSTKITTHNFSQNTQTEIYANPQSIYNSVVPVSFSGTVLTNTKQKALIIKPDGFVDTITLSTSSPTSTTNGTTIINNGGNFTFSYTPQTTGTYILEINNDRGIPSLNHPVYIANGIPLIPDYFDYTERIYFDQTLNLNNLRNELLQEINNSRNAHGLSSITLASDLSSIAQAHSQDMATNNYFAHINLLGEGPNDRRLKAGIETPVSENLAKDVNIKLAHEGLMRSAGHRQNILTPGWERVGLGIAEKDGYLYVTEEFATDVLTQADLDKLENDLLIAINSNRTDLGLNPINPSEELKVVITYLNDLAIQTNAPLSNSTFSQALELYKISGTSEAILRANQIWSDIVDSVLADKEYIYEASWKTIGIDVQTDNSGIIKAGIITNR